MKKFLVSSAVVKINKAITARNGKAFIVGGAVRDFILGIEAKDLDIEVYGLTVDELTAALSDFKIDAVGKSFGVLKVHVDEETFDVALPRSENKEGTGHRGFVVTTDPFMSVKDACQRRDITINALMVDISTGEIKDEVGGIADIENKIIRAVSPAFSEDPLRIMRACQFAARFGFQVEPGTLEMCKKLIPEMKTLPVERLWVEWKKLLLKSVKPSIGLEVMQACNAISLFPELEALIGVEQDPQWHPEGQVWIHNNMVIDGAARVCREDSLDEEESLIVMLGALCHDMGKPLVTELKAGTDGKVRWRAHDHEAQGVEPARSFLTRIGAPLAIIEAVLPLVKYHLKPFHLARDNASDSAIRRLAMKVPIARLCRVARADFLGRTTDEALECADSRTIPEIVWMLEKAKQTKVESGKPIAILMGRHLIEKGMTPGKQMGIILSAAFEAQLDGAFFDIDGAQQWLKNYKEVK